MSERLVPLSAMEKLMKKAGAERVSDEAKVALKNVIEEKAGEIARRATQFATHAGRKTIQLEDVKLAIKEM